MNIFITGGTGGVGACIVSALNGRGHNITCLTRNTSKISNDDIDYVHGHLIAPHTYDKLLGRSDAIIHMAATTHSPLPSEYFQTNSLATEYLLIAARKSGFKGHFIYMSTRALGHCCGSYGESKEKAEESVRKSGLLFTILRPAEVYGTGSNEAIDRVISMVKACPFVIIPGDGSYHLAPVQIDDIVDATVSVLFNKKCFSGTYNLSGPESFSYLDMVKRLEKHYSVKRLKISIPLNLLSLAAYLFSIFNIPNPPVVPDQIPRLTCSKSADNTKAAQDIDFKPIRFIDGIP